MARPPLNQVKDFYVSHFLIILSFIIILNQLFFKDVWSYGVVIWEMATYGDNPYSGKENEDVIQFVKGGGRLELPKNAPLKLYVHLFVFLSSQSLK